MMVVRKQEAVCFFLLSTPFPFMKLPLLLSLVSASRHNPNSMPECQQQTLTLDFIALDPQAAA